MAEIGFHVGWVSPNLSRLTSNDSAIPLALGQASWLVAGGSLGCVFGAVLGSVTNAFVGTRSTVLVSLCIMSASWSAIIAASSVACLYFGRFTAGVAIMTANTSFSLYLSEVARPGTRGTLVATATTGLPLGIVLSTVAESYLPMKLSGSIYLVVSLLGVAVMACLCDTPKHLVKRNDLVSARKSIIMYKANCDAGKELYELQKYLDAQRKSKIGKLELLKIPSVRKALVLVVTLFALPSLSGEIAIISYLETILINARVTLVDAKQFVIYTHVTGTAVSLLTVNLIDRFGRRVMLMVSGAGVAVAIATLGTYFRFLHSGYDLHSFQWLPYACVIVYKVTHSLGYVQVPSTVLGEVLTESSRSFGVCLACLIGSLVVFASTKIYQPIVDLAGEECIMWIFAGFSLVTILFALFVLPETKGKTFQEIQELLTGLGQKGVLDRSAGGP